MNSLAGVSSLVSAVSQIYSHRELEDQLSKIREMLSDDKHDWEHRVVAVRVLTHSGGGAVGSGGALLTLSAVCAPRVLQLKKVRSLMLAGAAEHEGFPQQLRLLEVPLKLSAKDLRSQVVREACITLG